MENGEWKDRGLCNQSLPKMLFDCVSAMCLVHGAWGMGIIAIPLFFQCFATPPPYIVTAPTFQRSNASLSIRCHAECTHRQMTASGQLSQRGRLLWQLSRARRTMLRWKA